MDLPYPDTGSSREWIANNLEGLEECSGCGLVFSDLEAELDIELEDIRSDSYRFPLNYHPGYRDGVRCLKMAVLYEKLGSQNSAARWYLYAGIILEREE